MRLKNVWKVLLILGIVAGFLTPTIFAGTIDRTTTIPSGSATVTLELGKINDTMSDYLYINLGDYGADAKNVTVTATVSGPHTAAYQTVIPNDTNSGVYADNQVVQIDDFAGWCPLNNTIWTFTVPDDATQDIDIVLLIGTRYDY